MSDPGEQLNLIRLVRDQNYALSFSPQETPEELTHRLEVDRTEREHQRKVALDEIQHDRRVFWAFSSVLTVVVFLSFLIVLGAVNPGPGDSNQAVEWARTIVSAIIAGLAGYLLPRARR